jgi:hypothetical protein
METDISRYLKCNAKFCYYYEELIERQETLSTDEHISVILYLWWISTDTDLLSDDECVHKCLTQKYKNQS